MRQDPAPARAARPFLPALFVALGLALTVLAYVAHSRARAAFLAEKGSELRAIADLKVSQIVGWRAERLADACVVSADPLLAAAVRDWLAEGARAERGAALHARLGSLRDEYGYERVSLLDAHGGLRLSVPGAEREPVAIDGQVREALAAPEVSVLDLHHPDTGEGIHLELVAPLRLAGDRAVRPVAFLVFQSDPHRFLYPLTQSWPTPSRSAETLLVRREGSEVVFLNELRHQKETALTLRLPVAQPDLPAALAVQGAEGVVEGVDYRGQRVLAAMRRVPGSPWFLVSKVDRQEIVAPLAREAWLTALLAVALIALAGLGVQRLWRRELKASDAELRESEARYRSLFDSMRDGFAYCRMLFENGQPQDFVYLEVNRAFETLTGLKRVVGRRVTEVIPGIREANPELFEIYGRVALTGLPERFETYVDPLGIWFAVSVYSPEKEHFIAVFDNITERRRAEEALKESEARLALIFNSVSDSVFLLSAEHDGSFRFRSINATFLTVTGFTEERVIGRRVEEVLPESSHSLVLGHYREAIRGRKTVRWEETAPLPAGTRVGEVVVTPIFDSSGRCSHLLGAVRDVTDRRLLEAQLRQAQKMEAIGQLAGGVAHDFNNLLNVIGGYSEMVLRGLPSDHSQRKRIEEICKAGERAAALTRQLLAFGRKQAISPVVLDLSQVVSGLEGMLRRLIPEHIQILTVFDSGAARVKADPGQVEQMILNLAVNARDAMPDGGRMIIEVSSAELDQAYCRSHTGARPGRYVLLAVSDTGTGMDAETQAHIFEPFFTTKEVGRGTGLGLASVYGIVKQHEGHIWAYSELGRGTTFKVYLPRVDDAVAHAEEAAPRLEAQTGSETVLLVEDDETVRELNREVLEDLGYRVLEARDGEAALEASARHEGPIHLLLTDMVMPGMTGRQLAEQLRSSRPGIRVLFVSGYTNDVIVRNGELDAGMAFLQKPFTPESLGRKIREVLGAPA